MIRNQHNAANTHPTVPAAGMSHISDRNSRRTCTNPVSTDNGWLGVMTPRFFGSMSYL